MKYRSGAKDDQLSILGFGCMRFKRKGVNIDFREAESEIMYAIEHGVNYFDTAYVYPGSEAILGEVLEKNKCRDQVKIATKLPHYLIRSMEGMEKLFQEELQRLRTDHVDYYLMHMLTDVDTWERLRQLGIETWIKEKLEKGQIKNIGFSYHGNSDMFIKLLDAYPWDFCQIQYNYMDENSQAGRKGLLHAHEKKVPVIIMEPLRGGKLVNLLPEEAKKAIQHYKIKRSPAEWAFRWLWDQKEVTCVLSGMNSMEMVEENIRIASTVEAETMTDEDFMLIETVKNRINENVRVGCTGCGYCMPCPAGVDIPGTFRCYNEMYTERKSTGRMEYLMCTILRAKPSSASLCIECGKCEAHCPQQIPIRKELKTAVKAMETPLYIIVKKVVGLFHFW